MDILQLESIVTTQLKVRVPRILDGAYPTLSFTTEITDKTPSFPNVYVHEMDSSEVGNSIPNDMIHAVRDTIQFDVTTNTKKADAHIVAMAVINAMKVLRYSVVTMPVYIKTNNLHRYTFRMRRTVANGDVF